VSFQKTFSGARTAFYSERKVSFLKSLDIVPHPLMQSLRTQSEKFFPSTRFPSWENMSPWGDFFFLRRETGIQFRGNVLGVPKGSYTLSNQGGEAYFMPGVPLNVE